MYLWKPLLAIIPAGLALGAVGGQMARPVLTQRIGDEPWQAMFQSRGTATGTVAYAPQTEGSMNYDGGFSYPPGWADGKDGPGEANSPTDSIPYYDAPPPTVAELDARQAALLADPEKEYAAAKPADTQAERPPQDAKLATADVQPSEGRPKIVNFPPNAADPVPEPQAADGEQTPASRLR